MKMKIKEILTIMMVAIIFSGCIEDDDVDNNTNNKQNNNRIEYEYFGAECLIYYSIGNTSVKNLNEALSNYNISIKIDGNYNEIILDNLSNIFNDTVKTERIYCHYYTDNIEENNIDLHFYIAYHYDSGIRYFTLKDEIAYEKVMNSYIPDKQVVQKIADIIIKILVDEMGATYSEINYNKIIDDISGDD